METVTYSTVLGTFCELAGLDPETLSDVDTSSFNRLFNRWIRRGWRHYFWPALLNVEQRAVTADGIIPRKQDGLDNIGAFKSIHIDKPLPGDRCPGLDFSLVSGGAALPRNAIGLAQLWVEYRPPCPKFAADKTDADVPAFLADFAAHGSYTDWLRGEGHQGKANAEASNPWNWLYDEIDNIERNQSQTRRWRFRR